MWSKKNVCAEWDMAWFCDKCEKMIHWKKKGWINSLYPNRVYCNECKEKIEREGHK